MEAFLEAKRFREQNQQRIEDAEKNLRAAQRRAAEDPAYLAVTLAEEKAAEAFDKFQTLEARRRGLSALSARLLACAKVRLAQLDQEQKTNRLLGSWQMTCIIPGDPVTKMDSGGTFAVSITESGTVSGTYRNQDGGSYPVTGRMAGGALTATATDGSDTYTVSGSVQADPLRQRRLAGSGSISLNSPKMKGSGTWSSR